jgi:hypothetical protein
VDERGFDAAAFDAGSLDDRRFDALFPAWTRHLSHLHWTPVAVAAYAARLLVRTPGTRVLDVGAGVGKLCLVGALVTPGVFHGLEQNASFVQIARAAAWCLHQPATRFHHGDLGSVDWRRYDAFYLYNPFGDHPDVDAHVRLARERLDAAPPGTRVATYHGFGGTMPPTYRLELEGEGAFEGLALWIHAA